jgi:hypothetical protein
MVIRQGAGEERFEVTVFAGDDHVFTTNESDDVVLFEKRFIGMCGADEEECGEQTEQEGAHGVVSYRRGQSTRRGKRRDEVRWSVLGNGVSVLAVPIFVTVMAAMEDWQVLRLRREEL